MHQAYVVGTGSYLPPKILTNFDLEKMVDTTDEWITTRTGIRERHIVEDETVVDLAVKAAANALANSGYQPVQIECLILATMTPLSVCPSTACLVQEQLGLKNAVAFDISAACSGFLFALTTAKQYIESGMFKNILVVASETMSKTMDYTDRGTCILFGDGAGAAVVSARASGAGYRLAGAVMKSDGSGSNLLHMNGIGVEYFANAKKGINQNGFFQMEGRELFVHAERSMTEVILNALENQKMSSADVDWFIPHQANKRIINTVANNLDIPKEKVFMNLEKYGNTSGASLAICLDEVLNQPGSGHFKNLVMCSFGGGLTFGANILIRDQENVQNVR